MLVYITYNLQDSLFWIIFEVEFLHLIESQIWVRIMLQSLQHFEFVGIPLHRHKDCPYRQYEFQKR